MSNGILRRALADGFIKDKIVLNFQCGFDGIKLHARGRVKCWPFTLASLDLEDPARSSPRTVLLASIYSGSTDPSSSIHDRIFQWCVKALGEEFAWKRKIVSEKITTSIHDDQARRKVYNMKGYSSKGSCFFCLNQSTVIKINDSNTIDRSTVKINVPGNMADGLKNRGNHTLFHHVLPLWDCPIGLFHVFSEGIHDRLIQGFSQCRNSRCLEGCGAFLILSLPFFKFILLFLLVLVNFLAVDGMASVD
uniref:Uncharacterized protein n=1 Tax=Caenorhabditis japonica TaxID=281687 RepID=A0A8R1HX90_CAEJA